MQGRQPSCLLETAMDRTQVVSLLILLVLACVLALAGTRAFTDDTAEGQDLSTPPESDQEKVPPAPVNWDPAWRYERRFA